MTEGWTKLSDKHPVVGVRCKWLIPFGEEEVKGEGVFYSQSQLVNGVDQYVVGFKTPSGLMVSPAQATYWMEVLA